MQSAPVFSHQADAQLSALSLAAWKIGAELEQDPEPEELLLDDHALEQLTTRNAQLASSIAAKFPENPFYPTILMVALIGALIDILFLIR